jgi:hypothetical protein
MKFEMALHMPKPRPARSIATHHRYQHAAAAASRGVTTCMMQVSVSRSDPGLQLAEMIVVPIVAKPTTMMMLMISMRFQLRNRALRSGAKRTSLPCQAEGQLLLNACKQYVQSQTWEAASGPLAELRACGIPWARVPPCSAAVLSRAMIDSILDGRELPALDRGSACTISRVLTHGASPEMHSSRQDESSQSAGKCACDDQKQSDLHLGICAACASARLVAAIVAARC